MTKQIRQRAEINIFNFQQNGNLGCARTVAEYVSGNYC